MLLKGYVITLFVWYLCNSRSLTYRIAKDSRFETLPCMHKGTYADDCIVNRVTQHRCYIVATCDRDLKRRLRKIPGVPIMYITQHRYSIERMPDAFGGKCTKKIINIFNCLAILKQHYS